MDPGPKLRWGAACLQCRKNKSKCDGVRPSCGRCTSLGRGNCTYGRDPPPSLEARLNSQFADFSQHVSVIAPPSFSVSSPPPDTKPAPPAARSTTATAPATPELPRTATNSLSPPSSSSSPTQSPRSHPSPSLSSSSSIVSPLDFPGPSEIRDLAKWDRKGELPVVTRQHLLDIVISQRTQFSVDFDCERWRERVVLPASDPNSFHPSLITAIAVAALSMCDARLKEYEVLFRRQVDDQLSQSIAFVDRCEDSMWARVLLVWHAFRYGRLKQALRLSNSNVSLALSANLHHMPHHNEYGQQREYGLLPPLLTQMHSIERSHLWWAIYLTDIQVSLNLGLMPNNYLDSLKPDSITTPLPIPFRMPIPEKLEDPTSLFAEDYQHVENDTVCGLRVKSTLLCAFAADVSRVLIYPDAPEEFWKKHRMGAAALAGFVKVLPPLSDMRDMDPGYPGAVSPGMLRVHTTALLGTYFVTGVHTLDEAAARKKRVEFALQIADVAKQLEDVAMIYPQVPIGLTWSLAADILVEELLDDERSPHSDDYEDIRNHLRIYADRLGQLQGFFTGLKPFLRYINEDLLNPNSSLDLISLRKRRPDSQVSPFILDGRV